MNYTDRSKNGILVIELNGELTNRPTRRDFHREVVSRMADTECAGLVVGVSGVAMLTIAGIGHLRDIRDEWFRQGGKAFAVAGPRAHLGPIALMALLRTFGEFYRTSKIASSALTAELVRNGNLIPSRAGVPDGFRALLRSLSRWFFAVCQRAIKATGLF